MSDQLVVVISGAGRGLGHALAQAYLARPNCTVVGTVRDASSPGVAALRASSPRGAGSELVVVRIDDDKNASPAAAMREARIDRVDVLIANAGTSPMPPAPLETVAVDAAAGAFRVNALAPLALFQACHALLARSERPRFVAVSSAAGSLGLMAEGSGAHIAPAYCMSKAALNCVTLAAHYGNEWLTAVAVNPGLVDTDMGNKTAEFLGLKKASYRKEHMAEKIIDLIDTASREKMLGKFINATDGRELPW
ncbi:NAD(P)-binding protein [Hypoxylon sp. FL1284]|nr:NAD(P)-binding protein [Hypoxylon sp. FL1284]